MTTNAQLRHLLSCILVGIGVLLGGPAAASEGKTQLWDALGKGRHVVLLRHALAPGTGDPAAFTLGDCSTQRNLSPEGRAQARRIGERFRAHGIRAARVYSSQWCRCLETARLLDLGPVRPLPVLNSFFRHPEHRAPQTRELREWLADRNPTEPLVLVTHQVNITALTGVFPASGEMVVLRRDRDGAWVVADTLDND